jgi:RecA/RadA recombinase
MAAKKNNDQLDPVGQIQQYLKEHKQDHYNFETETDYIVSSGSLILDMNMSGGLRASIIRASGVSEGGKTSCALSFARNFQKDVDNSMVVYVKAEGRLSPEMTERSGVDTSEEKWFVYKSNIFESVLTLVEHLIKDNPTNKKYFFIIDSMDALVSRGDVDRSYSESNKVAGGAVLSSNFLKRMALPISTRGHICFLISQVRSKVSINPYEKADPKLTNASGGNALLHFSDWILEFQPRYSKEQIKDPKATKEDAASGHWCKVVFRKTPNETTGMEVKYPIKYGRTGGKSIWVEYEVFNTLIKWGFVKRSGSWVTVDEKLTEELKSNNLEMPEKIQGEDAFTAYLEENPKLCEYLFQKLKSALTLAI